jgi:hypothetical protein
MQDGVAILAGTIAKIPADCVRTASTSHLRQIRRAHILVDVDRNVCPRSLVGLPQRGDFNLRGRR